ncbi:periplasmic binding protein-like II [Anaeromyces robustus]|uniref:Periplasmic binding protein-like II n=1 Tax=Anaeromyces robustus TaxID=1754192 RepID=A0A1Y1WZL0_9FUNG|nr:periplasmic binding protein-like II [Anaeromyces robustus]|eukprot:ORX79009.1 periplasmic binding protein-like II [Anaeromyces robustus]
MFIIRILIQLLLLYKFVDAITLNAIASSFTDESQTYTLIIDEFNKYAEENNIDIKVELNLLTNSNSTFSTVDFGSLIESLLKKNNSKYDIFFYDNLYLSRFGPHLLDLNIHLSKEHLDLYNPNVLKQSCEYKNKIVGLPITLNYMVLYANERMLHDYGKRIPKTWEELIETSKYIIEKQREKNNTNFVAYNGSFNDDELGTCSIHEFIYSYRDTPNSPYPKLTSDTAVQALEMIKRIKNEISSESTFRSSSDFTVAKILEGESLFLKFWIYPFPPLYKMVPLPGKNENVSGSTITGFNIGIKKDIKQNKKEAAIKALTFMTSKDIQMKVVNTGISVSAISSIYEEPSICAFTDCELYKNLQPIYRPNPKAYNYDKYSEKYRNYIYEFLYGNKTAYEVLKEVESITEYFTFSTNTENTPIGLIFIIIFTIITIFIVISTIFIFIENYNMFFSFLTDDFWLLFIAGLILLISSCFTSIEAISVKKCHLKFTSITLGLTLNYIPILHKLITLFPGKSKISEFCINHQYIFIFCTFSISLILNGLFLINTYTIEDIIINDKLFQVCYMENSFSNIIKYLVTTYILIIILVMLFYIFTDWSIKYTQFDIKLIVIAVYIDILSFIIIFILELTKIKKDILYYVIRECIIMIVVLSNYFLIYGFRIILALVKGKNMKIAFIDNISKKFVCSTETKTKSAFYNESYTENNTFDKDSFDRDNCTENEKQTSRSIITKIINYHYSLEPYIENKNQIIYDTTNPSNSSNNYSNESSKKYSSYYE